jgi:integrase
MRRGKGRLIGRLRERQLPRLGHGWHNDGGGLYLRVEDKARRWWVFRYGRQGRHYLGLGPVHTLSLAEARIKARKCRQLLLDGIDPIAAGKAARAAVKLTEASTKTFQQCAEAFHAAHCASWSNRKHAREWLASLKAHAFPEIGGLPVAAIGTAEIMRVLEPAWTTVSETASRLRSRIEAVLDWARVHGYRTGENPARWKGHLDHLLPDRKRVARVVHHRALPYRAIPDLVAKLRTRTEIEAHALEFVLLTAARASEACGADWHEIDLAARIWTVPAERMKNRREHRVPLAPTAITILERTPNERQHGPVFPNGARRGKTVTVIALWRLAQELSGGATTVHGLRSSFRDWAGEQTSFAREIIELALAHVVGGDTELAYRRGDMLEKRRPLMEAWASYCAGTPAQVSANVTPIGSRVHG